MITCADSCGEIPQCLIGSVNAVPLWGSPGIQGHRRGPEQIFRAEPVNDWPGARWRRPARALSLWASPGLFDATAVQVLGRNGHVVTACTDATAGTRTCLIRDWNPTLARRWSAATP